MDELDVKMIGVIFDMDGVLVDSELHWKTVESGFLQEIVPHWSPELQKSILGMSIYQLYDLLCAKHGLALSREEYLDRYKDLSKSIYMERCSLISGSRECAERLAAAGVRLAVASSSPRSWIRMVVERFALDALFPVQVSSDDVQSRGKPAPDIYLYAVERLGLPPAHCAAIEDSEKGIRSAVSAGLYCIGFRNGFNDAQDLSRAGRIVSTFESLDSRDFYGLLPHG